MGLVVPLPGSACLEPPVRATISKTLDPNEVHMVVVGVCYLRETAIILYTQSVSTEAPGA